MNSGGLSMTAPYTGVDVASGRMTDARLAKIKRDLNKSVKPPRLTSKPQWTEAVVAELVTALEAEREKNRFADVHHANWTRDEKAIARIRELHRPWKVYGECGHEHTDGDGSFEIDDVGLTCGLGYMYSVCELCCLHGDGESEQTEDCWAAHNHTKDDTAYCATMRVIKSEDTAGKIPARKEWE
jgi:hypothetical protein